MTMKRAFFVLNLALISGLVLSACDGDEGGEGSCNEQESNRVDTILSLGGDETTGADTFTTTCGSSGCHGSDGDSGPGPHLSNEIPEFTVDGLTCLLLTGYDDMPSQASLSDQQLADVVAYVQGNF
jgi:mono/diheme cytochrome c family protein